MITASTLTRQPQPPSRAAPWQRELAQAVTDPLELCRLLDLDPQLALGASAAGQFRLRVPRGFVRRMRRGDPSDPLLLQVLPGLQELIAQDGFSADPLAERAAMRAPGLLHKYFGRALLITTGACAIHCRYCFRREFPYDSAHHDGTRWRQALEVIGADRSIEELILSGGDPLSLSTRRLSQLTDSLRAIPHIRRSRLAAAAGAPHRRRAGREVLGDRAPHGRFHPGSAATPRRQRRPRSAPGSARRVRAHLPRRIHAA